MDLLGSSTCKTIPYSSWIKTTHNKNPLNQKMYRTDLFPLIEKKNLTVNISSSGFPNTDSKYTINQVFDLHDPLENMFLSNYEIENVFLPNTDYYKNTNSTKIQSLDN